ncbi:FusB/FusC family EF-G-binding protein [Clostridium sp.]|uniref:FusB/FusC family EF-G-binding protein n=1 Tax=Clostridium sp. TaxID=1506 RepID=UPI0025C098F1|nr:FusB/FusC family EF-G-binding protein [Clostridium sp.]MCI9304182.1 FusB/FusC family EF-G-binding protein [Clostridium sp.]
MNAFIKKQEFNYIKKCLFDLNNAFRNCVDSNIVETTKLITQDKILNFFNNLSDEEKEILDISKINEPLQIDSYLKDLDKYVYGMSNVTKNELTKVFKKEKKLKLPNLDIEDSKLVYLGWIDEATNKLLIVYNVDDKLLGMACRLTLNSPKGANVCTLCNHIGSENEVAFVSPICKPRSEDDYKSLGFHICLNSEECNERITYTEKLENILKTVNRIK